MEGSWRTVACTGAEAHGAALGMSGAVLEGYLEQVILIMIIMILMIMMMMVFAASEGDLQLRASAWRRYPDQEFLPLAAQRGHGGQIRSVEVLK